MDFVSYILMVAVFSLQLVDGGVPNSKNQGDYIPIVYPGPIKEDNLHNRYGTPNDVPEECRKKNYCTIKPPDYPQEKFNKMFKGKNLPPQPTLVIDNIADRNSDTDNCETSVTYEPFYKIRDDDGEWREVIQAPKENYVQVVRLETCKEENAACFTALPGLPNIITFCRQKTSIWQFVVTRGNGTEKVKAELPVCCSCHYRYSNRT